MPRDINLLMQGYMPVNGTGSHWYPDRQELPRSGPTPQFLAPHMFDDNNQVMPGDPTARRGLGFDLMDPGERGAGVYQPYAGQYLPWPIPNPSIRRGFR